MSLRSIEAACNHTAMSHVFYQIRCPNRSLTHRIATVVAALVLAGSLFAVRSVIKRWSATPVNTPPLKTLADVDWSGWHTLIGQYPQTSQEAMRFAYNKLHAALPLATYQFPVKHQPVNNVISLLTALYYDVYQPAFETALRQNQDNPWQQQAVLEAAGNLMKVAYTISCLTLEDLKAFTAKLKEKGETRTSAKALTRQDSYQYHTFFYCTQMYHNIRGMLVVKNGGHDWASKSIPDDFAAPFYELGTMQHSWNELYNDYCKRVRVHALDQEFVTLAGGSRYVGWTQPDLTAETFQREPDTLPN